MRKRSGCLSEQAKATAGADREAVVQIPRKGLHEDRLGLLLAVMEFLLQLVRSTTDRVSNHLTAEGICVGAIAFAGRSDGGDMLEDFGNHRIPGQIAVGEEVDENRVEIAIAELALRLPQRRPQTERESL